MPAGVIRCAIRDPVSCGLGYGTALLDSGLRRNDEYGEAVPDRHVTECTSLFPDRAYLKIRTTEDRPMKATARTFAAFTMAIALVGAAAAMTATSVEAGPRGFSSLAGLDLGSGR